MRATLRVVLLQMWAVTCGCGAEPSETTRATPASPVELPHKPAPRTVYLTWTNFDGKTDADPSLARYFLDGKPIGTGSKGFTRLVSKLETLPPESVVYLFPDAKSIAPLASEGGAGTVAWARDNVPFRVSDEQRIRFKNVADARRLVVRSFREPPSPDASDNPDQPYNFRGLRGQGGLR